ncbi:hypothetical protein RQP46_009464 [Phenoliferia psychrophenolica]
MSNTASRDSDEMMTKGNKQHLEDQVDLSDESQHGHVSKYLYGILGWSAFSSFAFGFSGACIGGVLVQPSFAVYFAELANLNEITGMVSIYHAGGVFGVLTSSYVSDRWGRKISFLYGSAFYIVGAIIMSAAVNLHMLLVGRLIIGWGAYGFLISAQTYAVELAPARSRGLLGSINGLALEVGYITAGWISVALVHFKDPMDNMSWRTPFILQFVPVVLLLAGYKFVPESPRWLVTQGRSAEALEVLTDIHASPVDPRGHFSAREHKQIVAQYDLDKTLPSSWISMFTTYRRRSLCAILIMWSFLLGGDYFLATYGPQLFTAFGFSTEKSLIYQAAWLTLLILNFGVAPLMDRAGRKASCLLAHHGDGLYAPGASAFVAMFMIYMLFLCTTEPPTYLLCCEIFPLHVRTKGTAIAYATLGITNTWTLEAAATMVAELKWKVFICFSAANVVALIVFIPETRNVPLEEMAAIFGEEDQVALREKDIMLDN